MKTMIVIMAHFCLSIGFAQNEPSEKTEIMRVVHRVFEAMRTNDSTLLRSCFVENPSTYTAFIDQDNQSQLIQGDFEKFVSAVGSPKEDIWNEPIWNEQVQVDGSLASVWVDYAFFVNDEFSHCGVDAFHLIQQSDGWKIFHLVDTRRRENCEVPDDVKP